MRKAKVLFKDEEAGVISQFDDGSFLFEYYDEWLNNDSKQSISLTLPKSEKKFYSKHLFPFFFNMLPEGKNKQVVCNLIRIDTDDYFGLLLSTAKNDSIGAVRIVKIENE
jgi:serine/threonine-protein kinase HipA